MRAPAPVRSTHEDLRELRKELNGLVAAWHHRTDLPHGVIHAELRADLRRPALRPSPPPRSSGSGSL